jgi:4-hydroxy-tetrahydrodipicolinate reductase
MTRLLVQGASGRLGRMILSLANSTGNFIVSQAGRGALDSALVRDAEVLLDVSEPTASVTLARYAAEAQKPLVIGSTGHDESQLVALAGFSKSVPLVLAPNFSIGVNLLFWLSEQVGRTLGSDFNIEILEAHHRHKKDAPSGTARRLAEIVAAARHFDFKEGARHGRVGQTGERSDNEIGLHALRGGDVAGEHTVYFLGQGERLELTHRASDRTVFARGALQAVEWVLNRPPGLYDMQDVLGLRR